MNELIFATIAVSNVGSQCSRELHRRTLSATVGGSVLASDGDELLTSDPLDLRRLAKAIGVQVDLVEV
jgi:hypothetical protein